LREAETRRAIASSRAAGAAEAALAAIHSCHCALHGRDWRLLSSGNRTRRAKRDAQRHGARRAVKSNGEYVAGLIVGGTALALILVCVFFLVTMAMRGCKA